MTKVQRNSTFGLIGTATLVLLLWAGLAISTKAQPSSINVQSTAVATTTVAYIGNGTATSTYQIDANNTVSASKIFSMAPIDTVYMYVQGAASSSATTFGFTVQMSNNGSDWYSVGTSSLNSAPTFTFGSSIASSTTATWLPGTTATSSFMFQLPVVAGLHERVLTSATGAAGAVYEEFVLKKNPSTP